MMYDEDDEDAQSFYSTVPWTDDAEDGQSRADDWPPALESYRAQSNLVSQTTSTVDDITTTAHHERYEHTATRPAPPFPSHLPLTPPAGLILSRDTEDKEAAVAQRHLTATNAHKEAPARHLVQRPSTAGGERKLTREHGVERGSAPLFGRRDKRSKTLSSAPVSTLNDTSRVNSPPNIEKMDHTTTREDLFLELANDQAVESLGGALRPTSHGEPLQSRSSFSHKRRSLHANSTTPISLDRRPQSSGQAFARSGNSRQTRAAELQDRSDIYASPSVVAALPDDAVSVSSASQYAARRHTATFAERSGLSREHAKSPEFPQFGRRRPSFGTSPRQMPQSVPDSASVDSQTADTVWDELDDLKSRIKKLELTGKLPPTAAAAISTEPSERPRTATTAPTTIDSSPKHEKAEMREKGMDPAALDAMSRQTPPEHIVGGPDAANIHPNLHAALAKAKPLLNPSLYRSLEASAADALQLASLTGSAGPQGTALTAAAIINGVTVSDRHVRRKADSMCRNLTDLVLALCEGRTEPSNSLSSPALESPAAARSPTLRYSRSSLDPNDSLLRTRSRPMSRLEARRTSILGSHAGSSLGNSPMESGEDVSPSEYESTTSRSRLQREQLHAGNQPRAVSRLQAARARRQDDDEDPTLRSVSRAATDIGRAKSFRDYSTPNRPTGFREVLAARRSCQEGPRELTRTASLASDTRRRFLEPNTPTVFEESGAREVHDISSSASSQAKRRVTSFGLYGGGRRTLDEMPGRTNTLAQRRQGVLVE